MEYYSVMRKKESLPFVTAWVDLEGIMLIRLLRRRKTNTVYHLYVESKTPNC